VKKNRVMFYANMCYVIYRDDVSSFMLTFWSIFHVFSYLGMNNFVLSSAVYGEWCQCFCESVN